MYTMPRSTLFVLVLSVAALSASAAAQVLIATVPAESEPYDVQVNASTNKTYVTNYCGITPSCQPPLSAGTVTIIDGATLTTQTVTVGFGPTYLAVNSMTNKIYVVNNCGADHNCHNTTATVTVVDGATLATQTVNVGYDPQGIVVNSASNKVYVASACADRTCSGESALTVIDGATLATQNVAVGNDASAVAVNTVTNKIYVSNETSSPTVTVVDGVTLQTTTVPVGFSPVALAVNSTTNKIYVANACGNSRNCASNGTMTVIDGATLATQTVNVGYFPFAVATNMTTNKIYVGNECGSASCSVGTVTAIDGATLGTQTVPVLYMTRPSSDWLAVNASSNKVYISGCTDAACDGAGTITAIDGNTLATTPITVVGNYPEAIDINPTTNRIYAANQNVVSVIGGDTKLQLVSVAPCRLVDTRPEYGGSGPIQGGTSQDFLLPQLAQLNHCGNLLSAAAYSLNVTVVPSGRLGFLTIWPTGESRPGISLMNSLDGRIKANAATVQAGTNGGVTVYVNNTSNLLIDVDGYFAPASTSTLQFYSLPPCRLVDTRNPDGDLGGPFLTGNRERDFLLLESSCIPSGLNPAAYSLNVTAVPHPAGQRLGFLTVWPAGGPTPNVSTLNNPTGTIVANAAIVPAGTNGAVAVFPNNDTDLLIDINGYFAEAGAGGLSLYPSVPCRIIDTRQAGTGQPFEGELTVNVEGSLCAPPSTAQDYVLNATVVPQPTLGFLSLWADGAPEPGTSTLNAKDGAITSNMAIVPTTNGLVDAYANALTQMILDISSYFAP